MRSLLGFAVAVGVLLAVPAASAQKAAPHALAKFNGQAAYELTQQYVTSAPHRWVGSPDHAKAEAFLRSHFAAESAKGNFEADSFTASTPAGQLLM